MLYVNSALFFSIEWSPGKFSKIKSEIAEFSHEISHESVNIQLSSIFRVIEASDNSSILVTDIELDFLERFQENMISQESIVVSVISLFE